MCHSTLMAIMARMSAYTGQEITFEQALNSQERLGPPDLARLTLKDAPPPTPLAVPGVTQFS
jgi:myo-inositol 2-dehydrogenase / D-chiro-inositol 1-dehydrogenase